MATTTKTKHVMTRKKAKSKVFLGLMRPEATGRFDECFPISATQGVRLGEVVDTLIDYLPEGVPLFPRDVLVDCSESFLIGELIREKVFRLTYEEVPYSTAVRVKSMHERKDGLIEIEAEVLVDRASQKGILIGKGGRMLKEIGTRARLDIEALLGTRVFLGLQINVRKGWTKDVAEIARLTSADE